MGQGAAQELSSFIPFIGAVRIFMPLRRKRLTQAPRQKFIDCLDNLADQPDTRDRRPKQEKRALQSVLVVDFKGFIQLKEQAQQRAT